MDQKYEVDSSRLLKVAEQKHQERKIEQAPAVSFRAVWREDGDHV